MLQEINKQVQTTLNFKLACQQERSDESKQERSDESKQERSDESKQERSDESKQNILQYVVHRTS